MPILDIAPELPRLSVGSCLRTVARRHRKSYASQIAEMASLKLGRGRITRREYFYYRLYDDAAYDLAEKRAFVGRKIETELHPLTCHLQWYSAAHDKLVCYSVLSSLGFPVPKTRAIFRRFGGFPGLPSLPTAESLARHLRETAAYPFFSKPVTGIRSIGIASVDAYDPETDELVFADRRRRVGVDDFIAALESFAEDGYLFQERLEAHGDVRRICGDRLATIRFIILLEEEGPSLFRALWKIPAGDNAADNFWRKGNIIAAIDPGSGRTWRAITGVGPDLIELDAHPNTGVPIKGATVPLWSEARDLCLSAAAAFPRLRMQAWDVAATSRGPVLIEVNIGGDYNLPQLASGKGMLDARFRRFLVRCAAQRGLRRKLWRLGLGAEP